MDIKRRDVVIPYLLAVAVFVDVACSAIDKKTCGAEVPSFFTSGGGTTVMITFSAISVLLISIMSLKLVVTLRHDSFAIIDFIILAVFTIIPLFGNAIAIYV
ncbi:MAG: hypothetical protein J3Q66DRAFT_334291 [Benniella sp.]|nr:MAG: hypothetical protein J3Q66DRAFT_334291 [Benniella sp.]